MRTSVPLLIFYLTIFPPISALKPCSNPHFSTGENNLHRRTPQPGNCVSGTPLVPDWKPRCFPDSFERYSSLSTAEMHRENNLVDHCFDTCRCRDDNQNLRRGSNMQGVFYCNTDQDLENCRARCFCASPPQTARKKKVRAGNPAAGLGAILSLGR